MLVFWEADLGLEVALDGGRHFFVSQVGVHVFRQIVQLLLDKLGALHMDVRCREPYLQHSSAPRTRLFSTRLYNWRTLELRSMTKARSWVRLVAEISASLLLLTAKEDIG